MSKLTEAQKAENKAAQLIREAAYKARRKEYDRAKVRAVHNFDTGTTYKSAMASASAASEAALNAMNAEREDLHRQITALQTKIEGLQVKYSFAELSRVRRETGNVYHQERQAVEKAVDAEFSDIANVWSSVAWAANVAKGQS